MTFRGTTLIAIAELASYIMCVCAIVGRTQNQLGLPIHRIQVEDTAQSVQLDLAMQFVRTCL